MTNQIDIANAKSMLLENIKNSARILGEVFLANPREPSSIPILDGIAALPSLDEWPFGNTERLAESWAMMFEGLTADRSELKREYQRLFIGPHHLGAPAWGSVYLDKDCVILGSSTVALCKWMKSNGIAINDTKREPEDHIGKMLVLLGWLASEKPHLLNEYLADHLMPWAPRYLELLREEAAHPFYRGLSILTDETLTEMSDTLHVHVKKMALYF